MQVSRNALCPCGSGVKYKKCCGAVQQPPPGKPRKDEDVVLMCMPTRGSVSHETLVAYENNMDEVQHVKIRVARLPVAEARNKLAAIALDEAEKNRFPYTPREWFVCFTDDDSWWPKGTIAGMIRCMRQDRSIDMLFGWHCTRLPHSCAGVMRDQNDNRSAPRPGVDCAHGDIVDVAGGGFHFVMLRLGLLKRVGDDPFTPEEMESEDWAFCRRARAVGARLVVGTAFAVAHVDPKDGIAYLPGQPPFLLDGNTLRRLSFEHETPTGIKDAEVREYGFNTEAVGPMRETAVWNAELARRRQANGGAV